MGIGVRWSARICRVVESIHWPTATAREADDIADLSFISGKTNRAISGKALDVYLPPLIAKRGAEPFAVQCMPTDAEFLTVDGYKLFLAEQRKLTAERLNAFIGIPQTQGS